MQPEPLVRLLDVPAISDDRGTLRVLDELNLPFQCKRVYWLCDVPADQKRGNHAHRALQQVFVAISGAFSIRVWKEDAPGVSLSLRRDGPALYVQSGCWRELSDFTSDAVALVLASEPYDPGDYVFPEGLSHL